MVKERFEQWLYDTAYTKVKHFHGDNGIFASEQYCQECIHWTEHGVDDISMWPFAVKHAVWLYNRVPNRESGLTPMELITKQKADHSDLVRSHV